MQELSRRAATANMAQDTTSIAYWAYHIARTAFFVAQSATGVLAQSVATGDAAKGRASFISGSQDAGKLFSGLALVRCVLGLLGAAPAVGAPVWAFGCMQDLLVSRINILNTHLGTPATFVLRSSLTCTSCFVAAKTSNAFTAVYMCSGCPRRRWAHTSQI
jgi:hypothetical protein